MASSEPENGVHLEDTQAWDRQFLFLAAVSSWLFVPMSIGVTMGGDWRGLLFLLVPAAIVALGGWLRRALPGDYAILYPDRIELPGLGARNSVVAWSEVTCLRWRSGNSEDSGPTVMVVAKRQKKRSPRTFLRLTAVSPADRLTLIRYLRLAGAVTEQDGWPGFCRRVAVPLAEFCQRSEGIGPSNGTPLVPVPASAAAAEPFCRLAKQRPFLTGVIFPLLLLRWVQMVVSRKMWWTLSAIFAISGVINIRVVWGQWISPFSELVVGVSGATFLLGLMPRADSGAPRDGEDNVPYVPFSIAVALIGVPLLGNAAALGWLPGWVAKYGLLVGFLVLLGPAYIQIWKRARSDRQNRRALEEDALRRWAVYESTGRLPPCSPQPETAPALLHQP